MDLSSFWSRVCARNRTKSLQCLLGFHLASFAPRFTLIPILCAPRSGHSTKRQVAVSLSAQEVADRLRERVQLHYKSMHAAFAKFDANGDGE